MCMTLHVQYITETKFHCVYYIHVHIHSIHATFVPLLGGERDTERERAQVVVKHMCKKIYDMVYASHISHQIIWYVECWVLKKKPTRKYASIL